MRFFGTTTALLLASPAAAMAEGTMPQMDFHNPLTGTQVLWMAVILVVLYVVLARWGLPEVGKVLENRSAVIARDLAAARGAKTAADVAVAQLNVMIKQARDTAQAQIAAAVAQAKAEAALQAASLAAKLDRQLAESEAQINAARRQAMAAIKPVASDAAAAMLLRLTGNAPGQDALGTRVDDALAARKAA
jgi:F-type H+-transporting ATPase subunit b